MKTKVILLFLVLFIYGCSQSSQEFPLSYNKMYYFVSEPDDNFCLSTACTNKNYVDFTFEGKYVSLDQRINYDCCADISLKYTMDINESNTNKEGILRIYEDNNNTLCGRTCTFVIKAKIKEKDAIEVELYGVKYLDWPYIFISEKKR